MRKRAIRKKVNFKMFACNGAFIFSIEGYYTHMQTGGNDYDTLAVAFATELVLAEQPTRFSFNQPEMHKRLHECFTKWQIPMFPVKQSRHSQVSEKRTEEVPVYCTCRMPKLPGFQWKQCSKCGGCMVSCQDLCSCFRKNTHSEPPPMVL